MIIPIILNGTKTIINAEPEESLLSYLRRQKIFSPKCGCEKGVCGNCMILLNGENVTSCNIPVGIIRDSEIVTLEYLKNNPIYQDITFGFNQAGIHLCGYCNAGKYFTAYKILQQKTRPEVSEIYDAIKGLDACCTDRDSLVNGILYAIAANHKRLGANKNVR